MSTITAVLKPDQNGLVHLRVPRELCGGEVRVTAKIEAAESSGADDSIASPEMLRRRSEAFAQLRRLNAFQNIPNPSEWQREIRQDRPLPGRD